MLDYTDTRTDVLARVIISYILSRTNSGMSNANIHDYVSNLFNNELGSRDLLRDPILQQEINISTLNQTEIWAINVLLDNINRDLQNLLNLISPNITQEYFDNIRFPREMLPLINTEALENWVDYTTQAIAEEQNINQENNPQDNTMDLDNISNRENNLNRDNTMDLDNILNNEDSNEENNS